MATLRYEVARNEQEIDKHINDLLIELHVAGHHGKHVADGAAAALVKFIETYCPAPDVENEKSRLGKFLVGLTD